MPEPCNSIFDTIKAFRERIDRHARSKTPSILQYDTRVQNLRPWLWPVYSDGERVRPEHLSTYRKTHNFYAPSCLCALLDGTTVGRKETDFYQEEDGSYWIACAENRCGYSVNVEMMYTAPMLPVRKYGTREGDHDEHGHDVATVSRRLQASGVYNGVPLAYRNPTNGPATTFGLLMQLDDPSFPGLPDDVFSSMFTQCKSCHWLTTSAAFPRHKCLVPLRERKVVIDLTLCDSDSDVDVAEVKS